jgi:hypothetical protein
MPQVGIAGGRRLELQFTASYRADISYQMRNSNNGGTSYSTQHNCYFKDVSAPYKDRVLASNGMQGIDRPCELDPLILSHTF